MAAQGQPEVVDLSVEETVQPEQQDPQERPHQRRRVTSEHELRDVYLVVHDGEPQDSGSDYRYSSMLHSTQDTKIIGAFRTYEKAAEAAVTYIESLGFIKHHKRDKEGRLVSYDTWFSDQCEEYPWDDDGFYRPEERDANAPNDRVRIQPMKLDQPQM